METEFPRSRMHMACVGSVNGMGWISTWFCVSGVNKKLAWCGSKNWRWSKTYYIVTLRKKCPYAELFVSVFSRIPTEYSLLIKLKRAFFDRFPHLFPEVYLEPNWISTLELFCGNSWQLKPIYYFRKKTYRRCLTRF